MTDPTRPHRGAPLAGRSDGAAVIVAALLVIVAACDGTDGPAVGLTTLTPSRAYSDAPIVATLRGGPFQPSLSVDTRAGTSQIDLQSLHCSLIPAGATATDGGGRVPVTVTAMDGANQLGLRLPQKLAAGSYDIELRDARGHLSLLKNAFQSLGPDLAAPEVKLEWPLAGTYLVGGTQVPVTVSANDGDGHLAGLSWILSSPGAPGQTHECPSPRDASRVTCDDGRLDLPEAPAVPVEIFLRGEAVDDAGNRGTQGGNLWLARAPVLLKFTPTSGPSTGMTEIMVQGQSFTRATRVLIDGVPLLPTGGIVDIQTSTITGFTPPHVPGDVPVTVETGNVGVTGTAFRYVAVPVIRRINPDEGPDSGGTLVTIVGSHFICDRVQPALGTQFFVGAGVVRLRVVVADCDGTNRVTAMMPPYTIPLDGTGAVSLFALDPTAGESELPNAFTYTAAAAAPFSTTP